MKKALALVLSFLMIFSVLPVSLVLAGAQEVSENQIAEYALVNQTESADAETNFGYITLTVQGQPADATVAAGTEIIVSVSPNQKYELVSLTYLATGDEEATEITANQQNEYVFTMPEADTAVTAVFAYIKDVISYILAPEVVTNDCVSVTLKPGSIFMENGAEINDAEVQYAVNTENCPPEQGWKKSTVLKGLTPGTHYYVFERVYHNEFYTDCVSAGAEFTTLTHVDDVIDDICDICGEKVHIYPSAQFITRAYFGITLIDGLVYVEDGSLRKHNVEGDKVLSYKGQNAHKIVRPTGETTIRFTVEKLDKCNFDYYKVVVNGKRIDADKNGVYTVDTTTGEDVTITLVPIVSDENIDSLSFFEKLEYRFNALIQFIKAFANWKTNQFTDYWVVND